MSAVDALRRNRLSERDLAMKNPVRVATIAALPAYTRSGNVILADANGALPTIDGVTMAVPNAFLLLHGASGVDNGVYVLDSIGSAGTKWQATRRWDMADSGALFDGMSVPVGEGAYNKNTVWKLVTNAAITLNTTALVFEEASTPSVARGIPMQEEFTGGSAGTTGTVGENGWSISASGGGTVSQIAGVTGHPGIRRLTTGAVLNSAVALYLTPGATAGSYISGDVSKVVAGFRPAPTGTVAEMTVDVGLTNDQNIGAATERVQVSYDPTASAFYRFITEAGGATETTVTAVTVTANQWQSIKIERDAATGNWLCYINDVLVATHAVTKPATVAVMPIFRVVTLVVVGEAKLLDADYFEVIPSPLTRY